MRYSRRKDAREVRYVAEMVVGAIARAVGRDGRRINGATGEGEREGGKGRKRERRVGRIERNPKDGWKRDRGCARRGEKEETRHAAGRTRASDGKTVIGSESEDNYTTIGSWVCGRGGERGG